MKDNELVRIVDAKRQTHKAKEIISDHNDFLRTDRLSRPDRYQTKTNNMFGGIGKYNEFATAQVGSQMKRQQRSMNESSNNGDEVAAGDVKTVQVKTANKSIRVMRHESQKKQ